MFEGAAGYLRSFPKWVEGSRGRVAKARMGKMAKAKARTGKEGEAVEDGTRREESVR